MDKVLAIVAEYNPFHNGHLYQLKQAKKMSGCNFSIAIMSGNFCQRGIPSILNKWDKTKMALLGGIDLVIELPLIYSISSAENFADGAIKIINSMNCEFISFGTETADLDTLNSIAEILYNEPSSYKSFLNNELKKGISFPKARENSLKYLLGNNTSKVISSPNNILAIEYLKALKKYNSKTIPVPILRLKSKHNDINITSNISSSTAIRNAILKNNYEDLSSVTPKQCSSFLLEKIKNNEVITSLSTYEKQIIYKLRNMNIAEISNLPDVSEGLEYSIKTASNSCNTVSSLINKLKSKRYTQTRIQRILLYALLNISKHDMEISKNFTPYLRVLGCNENGKLLLSKISKSNSNLNIITSTKRFIDNCSNILNNKFLNLDINSTNIYSLGYNFDIKGQLDFVTKIVTL